LKLSPETGSVTELNAVTARDKAYTTTLSVTVCVWVGLCTGVVQCERGMTGMAFFACQW